MTRVAIVAVHGVGSPPPFETARGVVDLMVQHGTSAPQPDGAGRVTYSGFAERFITIPTEPVVVPETAGGRAAAPLPPAPRFRTRLVDFGPGTRDRITFQRTDVTAETDLDVAFMRDQLAGYASRSERPPYSTIEIIGAREETGPHGRHDDVHIFEMNWADLSRVGSGLFRVLGALYQLVFHIAHLGRKTLDLARWASALGPDADREEVHWRHLATAHAWVVRLFTIAVPVSTLLLLTCVAAFVPDAVMPPERRLFVGIVILELAFLILLGVWTYFRGGSERGATRFVVSMLVAVVAGVLVSFFADRVGGGAMWGAILLRGAAVTLLLAFYVFVVNRYDRSVPGALSWGVAGLVATLAGAIYWGPRFLRADESAGLEALRFVALAAFQVSYLVLICAWLLIWGAALLTALFAWRLRWALRSAEARPNETRWRAARALWTAKATLAASLFGFVVTATVGYQALIVLAWRVHGSFNIFPSFAQATPPLIAQSLLPPGAVCPPTVWFDPVNGPAGCAKWFFDLLVAESGSGGLPIALLTAAVALLMISWFVALVAVTSLHRPKRPDTYATNVGNWIAGGFRWVRRAGVVFVLGLGVALSLELVVAGWSAVTGQQPPWSSLRGLEWLGPSHIGAIVQWLAIAALASSATLAAARVRLELIASRARPAVGIILDVDNYLRESPATMTPRAMMAERFTSLLRHIAGRRDEHGRPVFDRIIVVSHSQGTVLSADLLRFLTLAGVESPDLSHVDLRLVTMGSPLRQLYAVNFPHLYDWIDRTDDYGDGLVRDDDTAFAVRGIPGRAVANPDPGALMRLTQLSPSPRWLRVSMWVNLYTSGDYVGRNLWRTDDTPNVWAYEPLGNAATGAGRRERCLGDGTHTRYWTSPDVAQELDALITS